MNTVARFDAATAPGIAEPKRRAGRSRSAPEQALQKTIVEFLVKFVPPPPAGPFWTAINPVPAKSKAVAGLSKAMGLRAGVFDLLLVYHGLPIFFECKAERGALSKAQRKLKPEMEAAGAICHEVRSLNAFIDLLEGHGIPHRLVRLGCEVR